jgi:prepilin-type N-terminal cleavage/methylation domain-containing protein
MSMRPNRRRSPASRPEQGFTLLEMLVVMVIAVVLGTAVSYAMMAEVSFQRLHEQRRAADDRTDITEREITRILEGAKFSAPATPAVGTASTYFQGVNDGGQGLGGCDRLTLTTTTPGVPLASLYSTDDFQTQHDAQGPVGGVGEASLGMQPVGTAPGGQTGLFERLQRPSDTDPTQGGYEWVLDPNIADIGFEFWDGQQWQTSWDTTNGQTSLPQAVQVSYTIKNEPGSPVHMFVVPIPTSTIDAQHPASAATTTAGGGAAAGP